MAYNNNNNKSGGYKGNGAKTASAGGSPSKGKVMPFCSLAAKLPGEEELVSLTGLFENISAKGAKYGSVTLKEDVIVNDVVVFPAGTQLKLFFNKN